MLPSPIGGKAHNHENVAQLWSPRKTLETLRQDPSRIALATPSTIRYIRALSSQGVLTFVDSHNLHQMYLSEGTGGHAVIRRFHQKYSDVLARVGVSDIDDIVHEVFVSLSRTNFDQVQNIEHYLMRAIKLHCWSLLDKALRHKSMTAENRDEPLNDDAVGEHNAPRTNHPDQLTTLEGVELLTYVNLFKTQLSARDSRLLNLMIDETERSDIAKLLELNMNTLDTSIRRLRIRLAEFLKNLGYTYKTLERFV